MSVNQNAPIPVTQTVSTTPLNVFGASSWAGLDQYGNQDRYIQLTNNGSSAIYALTVTQDASPAVSSTTYEKILYSGDCKTFRVEGGESLQVVRSSGSDNLTARLYLV